MCEDKHLKSVYSHSLNHLGPDVSRATGLYLSRPLVWAALSFLTGTKSTERWTGRPLKRVARRQTTLICGFTLSSTVHAQRISQICPDWPGDEAPLWLRLWQMTVSHRAPDHLFTCQPGDFVIPTGFPRKTYFFTYSSARKLHAMHYCVQVNTFFSKFYNGDLKVSKDT